MPQPQSDWPKTLDEFRAWHERQPEVWEFIDGVPKRSVPGSKMHTLLKSNLGWLLGNALEGTGCTVLVDGAIVEAHGSSLIPDIVVTCKPLDFSTPRVDEPMIIVELLSPSGEKDDLGRKLALYLEVPSLRHYLVIHQDARRVVHHQRRDELDRHFLTTIVAGDMLRLEPPGIDPPSPGSTMACPSPEFGGAGNRGPQQAMRRCRDGAFVTGSPAVMPRRRGFCHA